MFDKCTSTRIKQKQHGGYLPGSDILTHERLVKHGELGRVIVHIQHLDQDGDAASLTRIIWEKKKRLFKKKKSKIPDINVGSIPGSEVTYFAGEHRDVVPLRHLSVERLQGRNGAILVVDVKESVGIRVLVYREPVNNS